MKAKQILLVLTLLIAGTGNALCQPFIASIKLNGQPQTINDSSHPYIRLSASPGADVTLTATVGGAIYYQWQFNQNNLLDKTNTTLRFTSLQLSNAGSYTIIATNSAGASSNTVTLDVDPTFSKIITGPIVTDVDHSSGGTWGDFNNDGYFDLFVYNGMDGAFYAPFLYRNNGDGTFSNVTAAAKTTTAAESYSACWGDYDNDGFLDLFATGVGKVIPYRNNGDATFTQITNSGVIPDPGAWPLASWADYDHDGLLDLLLANFNGGAPAHPYLYHNNGDGTFAKVASGSIASDLVVALGTAWGDYDNDGYPDLFISNYGRTNRLYHNDGNGTFTKITNGAIVTIPGNSKTCAWGDYDNDGFLDLFVVNGGQKNFLYHNNGDSTFTRITNDIVANDVAYNSIGCAWGDYDNDGWLDLYLGNEGPPSVAPVVVNFLYHNNGDGTFTKITNGSPVCEYSDSYGVPWGDYDNDGFLDLFASRGDGRGNSLYHNNGNSNNWLTVKLVGTASNRAAIGARVHARATIGGHTFWQLRQITGGNGISSGNDLRANFGLGDSTNVDALRIEWPSGTAQEFHDVAAKQILTITEPPQLFANTTNGIPQFSIKGGRFMEYDILASTDLSAWSPIGTVTITNFNGMATIVDTNALSDDQRFYRAVSH